MKRSEFEWSDNAYDYYVLLMHFSRSSSEIDSVMHKAASDSDLLPWDFIRLCSLARKFMLNFDIPK